MMSDPVAAKKNCCDDDIEYEGRAFTRVIQPTSVNVNNRVRQLLHFSLLALVALAGATDALGQPPVRPAPKDCFKPTFKSLHNIELNIQSSKQKPTDCSNHLFTKTTTHLPSRMQTARTFHWEATDFSHQPLYFDNVPLERYGQTRSPLLQPFISGAHFFGTLPVLPYKMGIDRYKDKIYTLGYYRSGSFAPCTRQRLPFEWDAVLFESGAWVALVLFVP